MIYIGVLIIIVAPTVQEQPIVQEQPPIERDAGLIYMTCDQCTWWTGYESLSAAKMGAASHRRWCKKGRGRKKNLFDPAKL